MRDISTERLWETFTEVLRADGAWKAEQREKRFGYIWSCCCCCCCNPCLVFGFLVFKAALVSTHRHTTDNQFTPRPQSRNVVSSDWLHVRLCIKRSCCINTSCSCSQPRSVQYCKSASVLDGVCDVEDELHVHSSLWDTSTTSVDDGDQSAVQLVHVALREEPTSAAGLVLHLRADTAEHKIKLHCRAVCQYSKCDYRNTL